MKKYWLVIKQGWQNRLVYRLDFILWRVRQLLTSFMSLFFWQAAFSSPSFTQLGGYNQDEMMSYIFMAAVLDSLINASALNGLSYRIYSGSFNNELTKPFNIFAYLGSQEVADKLQNFIFVIAEIILLFLIFQPGISIPGPIVLSIFLLWAVLGALINFLISLLFGAIGFWNPETWAPKFLFYMILSVTAGKQFPLDIMPKIVQKVVFLTPFPYLAFVQTQMFLNKLSPQQVIFYSFGFIFWLITLGIIVKMVWQRGLRDYSTAGQ
ncbi:MAG: ABC transporter permease [Patescibacteria group bacterium]